MFLDSEVIGCVDKGIVLGGYVFVFVIGWKRIDFYGFWSDMVVIWFFRELGGVAGSLWRWEWG